MLPMRTPFPVITGSANPLITPLTPPSRPHHINYDEDMANWLYGDPLRYVLGWLLKQQINGM